MHYPCLYQVKYSVQRLPFRSRRSVVAATAIVRIEPPKLLVHPLLLP
jgi:hypothetical protein